MVKGKTTIIITVGIACFILVMIIFMQFKVVYQTDIASIETMREEDLKAELANLKAKYESSVEKYNEIQETLKKYKEQSNSNSETKKHLEEELATLELMLGVTDVEGQGIVITLNDPANIEQLLLEEENSAQRVSSDELMVIVNYLKDAGAEAISINNQRIVNTTDFAQITQTYIKINSETVSPPYTIKAIGNPEYLKSMLIGVGYYDKIKKYGQEIDIKEERRIIINKYNGKMSTKYIEQ